MAAQWANHARAMATRINPSRPSIRPHSLSFSQTHLFGGLLSRCLRAAAAVKTRLLAHIEKKPRAPSADIADTAPDASFYNIVASVHRIFFGGIYPHEVAAPHQHPRRPHLRPVFRRRSRASHRQPAAAKRSAVSWRKPC
jgi:hypothetical protein